jgi:hypothetical protein
MRKIHFAVFVDIDFTRDLFDIKKKMIHAAIPIRELVGHEKVSLFVV